MADVHDVLNRLEGVKETSNGWEAQCPAHEDQHASLSLTVDGETIGIYCHAGCKTAEVVYGLGLRMSDLFPPRKTGLNDRITHVYDYHDAAGEVAFQVVRLRDPKEFRQRKDKSCWKMKGVAKVLYHLPEILAADVVIICEGEKDADRLRALGFTATCNPGGAVVGDSGRPNKKWLKAYTEALAGKHCILLADFDKPNNFGVRPGTAHVLYLANQLRGKAASVKIIELPGINEGQDVSDWLDGDGTADRLWELIDATPEWTPETKLGRIANLETPKPEERAKDAGGPEFGADVLQSLNLIVLGELEGGHVKVFSKGLHKTDELRDVNKVTKADLLRICGSVALGIVFDMPGEVPPGMFSLKRIRQSIAYAAGKYRITDESESGPGVWPVTSKDRDGADAIVFVGAGEAAALNGEPKLKRIETPRYGNRLLDLSSSEPWYDFAKLQERIDAARDVGWRLEAVRKSDSLWGQWLWREEGSPQLVTGLILATWLQACWAWRPQVMLTGESSSGKSTLFDTLAGTDQEPGIFGGLAVKSSQSTAPGIRQELKTTARILLCDEFDSNKHRKDIMELLRSAGTSDRILRGTINQRGKHFRMHHIAWVAGIESGLQRDPDRNRFIGLELIRPPRGTARFKLPASGELFALGKDMLAAIVVSIEEANRLIDMFRENIPEDINVRQGESYALPVACYAAVTGMNREKALASFLTALDQEDGSESESDHDRLLQDILAAFVDIGKGERQSVAELLQRIEHLSSAEEFALNRHGVGGFYDNGRSGGGDRFFFDHNTIRKRLLRGTEWQDSRIDQILVRTRTARKVKKILAGRRPHGILIYREMVLPVLESISEAESADNEIDFDNLF